MEPLTLPDAGVSLATCMRLHTIDANHHAWVLRPLVRGRVDFGAVVQVLAAISPHDVSICVTHQPGEEPPVLVRVLHTSSLHAEEAWVEAGASCVLRLDDPSHDVVVVGFRASSSSSLGPILHAASTFVLTGGSPSPHILAQLAAAAMVTEGACPVLLRMPRASCSHCSQAATSSHELWVCDACHSVILCDRCARMPERTHPATACLAVLCAHALHDVVPRAPDTLPSFTDVGLSVRAPAHLYDAKFGVTPLPRGPATAVLVGDVTERAECQLLLSAMRARGQVGVLLAHLRHRALRLLEGALSCAATRSQPSIVAWPAAAINRMPQAARLRALLANPTVPLTANPSVAATPASSTASTMSGTANTMNGMVSTMSNMVSQDSFGSWGAGLGFGLLLGRDDEQGRQWQFQPAVDASRHVSHPGNVGYAGHTKQAEHVAWLPTMRLPLPPLLPSPSARVAAANTVVDAVIGTHVTERGDEDPSALADLIPNGALATLAAPDDLDDLAPIVHLSSPRCMRNKARTQSRFRAPAPAPAASKSWAHIASAALSASSTSPSETATTATTTTTANTAPTAAVTTLEAVEAAVFAVKKQVPPPAAPCAIPRATPRSAPPVAPPSEPDVTSSRVLMTAANAWGEAMPYKPAFVVSPPVAVKKVKRAKVICAKPRAQSELEDAMPKTIFETWSAMQNQKLRRNSIQFGRLVAMAEFLVKYCTDRGMEVPFAANVRGSKGKPSLVLTAGKAHVSLTRPSTETDALCAGSTSELHNFLRAVAPHLMPE